MENKINIAELLTDCPRGMELDCVLCENVTFGCIVDGNCFPIQIQTPEGDMLLSKYGCTSLSTHAKCVIFPKGKTTWEGFHRPFVDGDIVAIDSAGGSQVFIFEEYIRGEKDYAHCYLMLDDNGAVDLERGDYYVERFASREEQERLFEAIKEKGYRWDPVNNTLGGVIEPKFKVGDTIQDVDGYKVEITEVDIDEECYEYISTIARGIGGIPFEYQDLWELVPNKFDITTLIPFESRVLVRECETDVWQPAFYGFFNQHNKRFYTTSTTWLKCIPYNEDTKHLTGTTNDCDEFYKTWE